MIDKVIFVPRPNIEAIQGWENWAVISIGDPTSAFGRVKLGRGWSHILQIDFYDFDPERYPDLRDSEDESAFMSAEEADVMVRFITSLPSDVDGIVVQCHAGVSRSAAVAKWIAGRFRIPFSKHYDKYNLHVYKLMIEAGNAQ